jgi:hypothetical protein
LRTIAEQFSVSTTSLFRHKDHVSEVLKKAHEIDELSDANALKAHLKQLVIDDARRIQQAAEANAARWNCCGPGIMGWA